MSRARAPRLLICLGLFGLLPAPRIAAAAGPQANALQLVRIAEAACARTGQAAQGRLDPRDPRSAAFRISLDRMQTSLSGVAASLRQRDLAFFKALRSGSVALAQLSAVWSQGGIADPAMDEGVRTLAAAYRQLREHYGPEWVRYRSGKPLSEEEKRRFERMRAEQARLAGQLAPLRDRTAAAGDQVTAQQLALLLAQAQDIATAPMTLDAVLDASVASDDLRGTWYGTRAIHPEGGEDWTRADDTVEEIYTDESIGFVLTTDLTTGQSWSYVEKETDLPEEVAAAEPEADAAPADQIEPGETVVFEEPDFGEDPALSDAEAEPAVASEDEAAAEEEALGDDAEADQEAALSEAELVSGENDPLDETAIEDAMPEDAPAETAPAAGDAEVEPETAPENAAACPEESTEEPGECAEAKPAAQPLASQPAGQPSPPPAGH